MSDLQLVEALCGIIEIFCALVRRLVSKLEQIEAFDEADRQAVDQAFERYSRAIGALESPGREEEKV